MCGTDFYIIVLQKVLYLCADNKSANGHPYRYPRARAIYEAYRYFYRHSVQASSPSHGAQYEAVCWYGEWYKSVAACALNRGVCILSIERW